MKGKKYLHLSFLLFLTLFQQTVGCMNYEDKQNFQNVNLSQQSLWSYSMQTSFNRNFNLFENFDATPGYRQRQNDYLDLAKNNGGLYGQSAHIYSGLNVNKQAIISGIEKIYELDDCMDFRMNAILRMLYLDLDKGVLNDTMKDRMIDALGRSKYWYTEMGEQDTAIFTTENHQIMYHTAEYLVGQLFPNTIFSYSGMTGAEHIAHALPLINRWLNWRGQFGFSEFHSNTYYVEDVAPLVNLVDFAMDEEVAVKAAMVLDMMAFDFAINYYKNVYATTMGRCYDRSRIKNEGEGGSYDSISNAAWIMVGVGDTPIEGGGNMAACALATSDHYAPPPILEDVAHDASHFFEGYERNNIDVSEGPQYGLDYLESGDLMYWWGVGGMLAPEVIEQSYYFIEKYDRDPMTALGPQILHDALKLVANLRGKNVSQYSDDLKIFSKGLAIGSANTYIYRTPYYQLAGAQDHKKGQNAGQELNWQATIDDQAYILTSSPGGYSQKMEQMFMGGWRPKGTFHKNVGILQYDREVLPLEFEVSINLLNLFLGYKFYTHAYFPKWAFDTVREVNKWTFGQKGDSFVALYTYEPSFWASNYELKSWGQKNAYIVELGSIMEYGSFDNFTQQVSQAPLCIAPQKMGYSIQYDSPTQGVITVDWDDPMTVAGSNVNSGSYKRFNNRYCQQEFGVSISDIQFKSTRLLLNFDNCTRLYQS